jgi:hypothetical protein
MEEFEFEEEYEEECYSLYEEEEREYYDNVLYPQIDTLNRR